MTSHSNPIITLRPYNHLDFAPLALLFEREKRLFLDDYDPNITLEWIRDQIDNDNTTVLDWHGYAIGGFWLDEQCGDCSAKLHALFNPEYMRQILREKVPEQYLRLVFDGFGINKLWTQCYNTQKPAIKLLKRHQFFEFRPMYKHTKQNGVKVDLITFELTRRFWSKQNGQRQEQV